MHAFLKDLQSFTLDTLFPIHCLLCNSDNVVLCSTCVASLTKITSQVCIVCCKPSLRGITHAKCQTPHAPDGLFSLFDYHDKKVAETIIIGKYKFISDVYSTLGTELGTWIIREKLDTFFKDFTIVPLPLAVSRQRWRGFNQAEVLAEKVSNVLQIPVIKALGRVRSTKTQKDLKKEARTKNVTGAFALAVKAPKPWHHKFIIPNRHSQYSDTFANWDYTHKNILLIDDVTTTGSTLLEATKVLKRNGVAQVWCITVAKD